MVFNQDISFWFFDPIHHSFTTISLFLESGNRNPRMTPFIRNLSLMDASLVVILLLHAITCKKSIWTKDLDKNKN